MVFRNLINSEFGGQLYPINPKHKAVQGQRCYASVQEIGKPIDLAVIASPAATVAEILRDCADVDVRHAIVLSAGFGETGEAGRRIQDEVSEIAKRNEIRFVGPNCVGLVRPWLDLNASFLRGSIPRGKLALISQSGLSVRQLPIGRHRTTWDSRR